LGDDKLTGQCLNNIGATYTGLGEIPKALEYLRLSLEVRRRLQDVKGQAATLNNIGLAYDARSDRSNALLFYRQSLAKLPVSAIQPEWAGSGNLGIVYTALTDYGRALEYHHRESAVAGALGNRRGEAATLHNIGVFMICFMINAGR